MCLQFYMNQFFKKKKQKIHKDENIKNTGLQIGIEIENKQLNKMNNNNQYNI